jgi:hypothetical protein
MPRVCTVQVATPDAHQCAYTDWVSMFVREGNLKCHPQSSHPGQPCPPAHRRQVLLLRQRLYSSNQICTKTPEPDADIPRFNDIPEDTDSEDISRYRRDPRPHSTTQIFVSEEAALENGLIDERNTVIEVHPTAGRIF